MDAVLGLSMTPTTVGLVLVEGQEADGATMDKDEFEVHDRGLASAVNTSEKAAAAVMRTEAIAAARGHRLHSIGVTWSEDADTEASLLLESLSESGFENVVAVRLPEATEALARGIADVIGHQITAVCVIEPDAVIGLVVDTTDGAVQTAVNHAVTTDEDLARWLSSIFAQAEWRPRPWCWSAPAATSKRSPRISKTCLRCRFSCPRRPNWRLPAARPSRRHMVRRFLDETGRNSGSRPDHSSAVLAVAARRRGRRHARCRRRDLRGFRVAGHRDAADLDRERESGR